MDNFTALSRNLVLLEIYTLKKYPESRTPRNRKIEGVLYKNTYVAQLDAKHPFDDIDWDKPPFKNFLILKTSPPKPLVEKNNNLEFGEAQKVRDWGSFIDSFRQLRNNITHGAKLFFSMQLEPRDDELISAGLAFINFLNDEFSLNLGG